MPVFIRNSLRIKLILLFTLMVFVFTCTHVFIRYTSTLPQLYALEVAKDKRDIQKLVSAFERIASEMQMLVYDNAVWDELHEMIRTKNIDYLKNNYFIEQSLSTLNINGMAFYDVNGSMLAEYMIDGNNASKHHPLFQSIPPKLSNQLLINQTDMQQNQQTATFKKGIFEHQGQPILFVSGSIIPSSGIGEFTGTMLVWAYLDDKIARAISDIMQTQALINTLNTLPQQVKPISYKNLNQYQKIRSPESSRIYVSLNDVFDKPVIALSYPTPKRMFDANLFETSMVFALISSFFLLGLLYWLVTRMIITPLSQLSQTVLKVLDVGDFNCSTKIDREDEIGHLSHLIDILFNKVYVQQNALRNTNRELKRLSNTDPLTTMANRRAMMDYLKSEFDIQNLMHLPLSFLMIDIDYFKLYNDNYGHQQGDETLKRVASTMQSLTRKNSDMIARYGGEEFTVILPNADSRNAQRVANDIQKAIEALKIPHSHSEVSDFVTVSIGVVSCESFEGLSIEKALSLADKALYQAKETGRNKVCVSSAYFHQAAS